MSNYFAKTLSCGFDEAVHRTAEALKNAGFGIITEIDVKETLKKKIDVDFRHYVILGACNPRMAYEALKIEDKVGTRLDIILSSLMILIRLTALLRRPRDG